MHFNQVLLVKVVGGVALIAENAKSLKWTETQGQLLVNTVA